MRYSDTGLHGDFHLRRPARGRAVNHAGTVLAANGRRWRGSDGEWRPEWSWERL